jgi:hypothetical protein
MVTVKDRTPIPLIDNIVEQLSGAKIFIKLDLKSAYNRVRIKRGDKLKTAWRSCYGRFEYAVMPFDLVNVPAIFQSIIKEVLQEFTDACYIMYLDDVLIYKTSVKEHIVYTRKIIKALVARGLYGSAAKCIFNVTSINFLGYVVSPEGVSMYAERVATIAD